MVENNKRKKYHDKDKYYRLAKEQGYRSRAAFKLTQINRKFHFLENAKVVIDLCAAPGGFTQVAQRTMAKTPGNIILAVDILPIRAIPNVITLIGDITTEKCKAQIKAQLQTLKADVVLCDGAPDVGASYDRDAYMQNEIALHSLKCATQHLKRNGTFVTKLYRSADYSSYVWIVKQLFQNVQAVKPNASRSQSAEIFLVCTGYLDPTKIDERMFDPQSVFEQVDGAAAGGGDAAQNNGQKGITIFHKKFDEKTRSRGGYDMTNLDASMRNIGTVADFIESGTYGGGEERKDPIQMLSFCTGLSFACHFCKEKQEKERKGESTMNIPDCNCNFFLNHRLTTPEIKECLSDLKVLNKSDFKGLLTWREKLRDDLKNLHSRTNEDEDSDDSQGKVSDEEEMDSDAEEANIQADIEKLRMKKLREQKRLKKKERELAAKRRKRAALGMDLNAIELPEAERMFTLTSITSKGALEAAREVDLNKVSDDQLILDDDDDEVEDDENVVRDEDGRVIAQGEEDDVDEETGYSYRLDRELDDAYNRYLKTTKTKGAKTGTKMVKRSKRAMREKAMEQAKEDQEMMMDDDTKKYAEMLQGPKDSDDDSSDDEEENDSDDDGFNSTPMTPEEHSRKKSKNNNLKKDQTLLKDQNPLIHRLPEESTSVKTARWFSNPLFENIGTTASFATMTGVKGIASKKDIDDYDSESDDHDIEELSDGDEDSTRHLSRKNSKRKKHDVDSDDDSDDEMPLTAESILDMMPKTDKQVRHEKRLKSKLRMEKKKARRERLSGEADGAFEVVEGDDEKEENEKFQSMSVKEKQKVLEARALIKAGLGNSSTHDENDSSGFEIVKKSELLPTMDPREYNSENEDYDSDDYAETLALGTMMLRKSKAKALVDASYNRFAWNDPEDLPDWFLDDENKNYRPQLPIPPELLAKMKERFMSLAVRPITKVAEARARKNKRAKAKLVSAKKKAEAVANSSDLSEAMKLKAISKAMRGKDAARPSKTYVVAKKGAKQGGKGVKLVDKRLKNDKRSMARSSSRKKNGKKGGLTGSKKRRSHS